MVQVFKERLLIPEAAVWPARSGQTCRWPDSERCAALGPGRSGHRRRWGGRHADRRPGSCGTRAAGRGCRNGRHKGHRRPAERRPRWTPGRRPVATAAGVRRGRRAGRPALDGALLRVSGCPIPDTRKRSLNGVSMKQKFIKLNLYYSWEIYWIYAEKTVFISYYTLFTFKLTSVY